MSSNSWNRKERVTCSTGYAKLVQIPLLSCAGLNADLLVRDGSIPKPRAFIIDYPFLLL